MPLLSLRDAIGNIKQMLGKVGFKINPVVYLTNWNYECMPE